MHRLAALLMTLVMLAVTSVMPVVALAAPMAARTAMHPASAVSMRHMPMHAGTAAGCDDKMIGGSCAACCLLVAPKVSEVAFSPPPRAMHDLPVMRAQAGQAIPPAIPPPRG